MRRTFGITLALAVAVGLLGCENKQLQTAMTDGPPPQSSSQPEPMTFNQGDSAGESGPSGTQPAPAAQQAPPPQRMDMPPEAQPAEGSTSAEAATGQRTYTIQDGDTLYSLAERFYGDGQQWQQIVDANPNLDPKQLRVGQKIVIPRQ